ncbi:hypothetical protein CRG98_045788, partial [Punica granatum]
MKRVKKLGLKCGSFFSAAVRIVVLLVDGYVWTLNWNHPLCQVVTGLLLPLMTLLRWRKWTHSLQRMLVGQRSAPRWMVLRIPSEGEAPFGKTVIHTKEIPNPSQGEGLLRQSDGTNVEVDGGPAPPKRSYKDSVLGVDDAIEDVFPNSSCSQEKELEEFEPSDEEDDAEDDMVCRNQGGDLGVDRVVRLGIRGVDAYKGKEVSRGSRFAVLGADREDVGELHNGMVTPSAQAGVVGSGSDLAKQKATQAHFHIPENGQGSQSVTETQKFLLRRNQVGLVGEQHNGAAPTLNGGHKKVAMEESSAVPPGAAVHLISHSSHGSDSKEPSGVGNIPTASCAMETEAPGQ